MGIECKEKLSTSKISQLETRIKRGTNYVCYVKNWKNGKIHERLRSKHLQLMSYYTAYSKNIKYNLLYYIGYRL